MQEYRTILDSGKLSAEKIRTLEKRIRQDKKCSSVMTDMRRSTMRDDFLELLFQGVIQFGDLEGFSQELRDNLTAGMQIAT